MKYSTFLRQVAECVAQLDSRYENLHPVYKVHKQPWMCNIISYDYFQQYPAHVKKLQRTIQRKIKENHEFNSLTFYFSERSIDPIKGRVNWLHTLAAIHESKGN